MSTSEVIRQKKKKEKNTYELAELDPAWPCVGEVFILQL